jgi:hypothetical protein
MLLSTFDEIGIPYHVIGGTVEERLEQIVELFDLPKVLTTAEAIELAQADYGRQDLRLETERVPAGVRGSK